MTRLRTALGIFCIALTLSACGGGGGGDGGGGDAAPSGGVSFAPAALTANVAKGQTATLTVVATASESSGINGSVYVVVADPQGVLAGPVNLTPLSARSYSATLYTSPMLPVGRHQGSFQVHLCRDVACASEYPGSPLPLPYDLTVSGAPLTASPDTGANATVNQGGTVRTKAVVSVTVEQQAWTASTTTEWLKIEGGTGTGNGTFQVAFDATGKGLGTYTANVQVRTTDGQTVDLPFSLTVLPEQFVVTSGVPEFSAVNGADIPAVQLGFELNSQAQSAWTATSPTPWLIATPLQGTTPATLTLKADPSRGPLASGIHDGSIVLSAQGVANKVINTRLTLVQPTLTASANAITLGGPLGRDLSAKAIQVALNTGSVSWPWALTGAPAWLQAPSVGQVSGSGAMVSFSPKADNTTVGSVSGAFTLTAQVNGDTVSLPLTANLNRDQRRLLPSAWGVGFAETAGGSSPVARTLKVADNFGGTLAWTATSSTPWLSVTPSGSTTDAASALVITANPAMLPPEVISEASITVSTTEPGVEPAVVRVAFWKSAAGAGAVIAPTDRITEIVADPVRPLVYAHSGGSTLDVYNAYSAQKVGSAPDVAGALGAMSVSPDGSLLYVLDTAASKLVLVDLATRAPTTTWPLTLAVGPDTRLLVIRPNGVEVALVGNGKAYAQGKALGDTGILRGSLAATADGRRVFAQDTGLSPASVASYDVDFTAISGGVLSVSPRSEGRFVNGASNGQDIAVRADGGALYTASGAPYRCSWLKPDTLELVGSLAGGSAYPDSVEVTIDGRVLCGIAAAGTPDFFVHSADGAQMSSHTLTTGFGQLKAGGLAVTADGGVAAALTEQGSLQLVWIGY